MAEPEPKPTGSGENAEHNLHFDGVSVDSADSVFHQYSKETIHGVLQLHRSRSGRSAEGRETWDNKGQFLMSCLASAVGLGNVWRFPAVCARNGGASFFIPYVICLFVIAKPLFLLELSLGQFSSKGSVYCWELSPIFTGVGYAGSVTSVLLSSFYILLMAWALLYMLISGYGMYTGDLPWGDEAGAYFGGKILRSVEFNSEKNQDVWSYVPIPHLVSVLLIAWLIIWGTMVRGVRASGKVAYVTALAPYVVLIILIGIGLSLEGMYLGIEYLIIPDFHHLLEPKTWFEAVGQCFFSLGIGFGGLIMFSSFNDFNHPLGRDVLVITIVDFVTSILAGFSLMTILGFQATKMAKSLTMGEVLELVKGPGTHEFKDMCELDALVGRNKLPIIRAAAADASQLWRNSPIRKKSPTWDWIVRRCQLQKLVADGGAGIAFVEYPSAMVQVNREWGKYLGGFLAFIFFLMLILLAVGSANGFVGTTVTIISDRRPEWKRSRIVTGVCALSFFIGLLYTNCFGSSWIDVVDTHGVTAVVYVLGFFEAVAVIYVYGLKRFCDDMEFMRGGKKVSWLLKICWALLPIFMLVVYIAWIVQHEVPATWTLSIRIVGWLITAGAFLVIPGVALYKIWQFKKQPWRAVEEEGYWSILKGVSQPGPKWGPRSPGIRSLWLEFKADKSSSYACWGGCCGRKPVSESYMPIVIHPEEGTESEETDAGAD